MGLIRGSNGGGSTESLSVVQDTLSSSLTGMTSASFATTGLAVTFTTTQTDEWVTINTQTVIRTSSGNAAAGTLVLALELDSDAEIPCTSYTTDGADDQERRNASFSRHLQVSTAGEHTVTLKYKATGSTSWEMPVDASTTQLIESVQIT